MDEPEKPFWAVPNSTEILRNNNNSNNQIQHNYYYPAQQKERRDCGCNSLLIIYNQSAFYVIKLQQNF